MKKFAIVAVIAALTSCGGNEEKAPAKTDSMEVKKSDSTKVEETKTVTDTVK